MTVPSMSAAQSSTHPPQALNALTSRAYPADRPLTRSRAWTICADIDVDDNTNVLTAVLELPGVRPSDISIRLTTDIRTKVRQLFISGTSRPAFPEGRAHTIRERKYGQFSRHISVPLDTQVRGSFRFLLLRASRDLKGDVIPLLDLRGTMFKPEWNTAFSLSKYPSAHLFRPSTPNLSKFKNHHQLNKWFNQSLKICIVAAFHRFLCLCLSRLAHSNCSSRFMPYLEEVICYRPPSPSPSSNSFE